MKSTAEKMFNDLGFEIEIMTENELRYSKKISFTTFGSGFWCQYVVFNLRKKSFHTYTGNLQTTTDSEITMDILEAIVQQCKELGWDQNIIFVNKNIRKAEEPKGATTAKQLFNRLGYVKQRGKNNSIRYVTPNKSWHGKAITFNENDCTADIETDFTFDPDSINLGEAEAIAQQLREIINEKEELE